MTCLNDNEVFDKIMIISPSDLAVLNQIPTKQSKIAKFMLEIPIIGTLLYHMIVCKPNVELLLQKNICLTHSIRNSLLSTHIMRRHISRIVMVNIFNPV